ncbi:hypothetical protein P8452_67575 [Trifolium repens]|nr:hypothetical protein P8452_67575 [Trifolium repens]
MRIKAEENAENFKFVEEIMYDRATLLAAKKNYLDHYKKSNLVQKLFVVNSNPLEKKELQETISNLQIGRGTSAGSPNFNQICLSPT